MPEKAEELNNLKKMLSEADALSSDGASPAVSTRAVSKTTIVSILEMLQQRAEETMTSEEVNAIAASLLSTPVAGCDSSFDTESMKKLRNVIEAYKKGQNME